MLENVFGLDLGGWHLRHAYDISDDGKTIVGYGLNPDGNREAWIVYIGDNFINIISPKGEEELLAGTPNEITWTFEGDINNVKIEYSVNNGTDWSEIVSSIENDGSYDWEVPCEISTDCLIRISDVDSDASDVSNTTFTISCGCVANQTQLLNALAAASNNGQDDTIKIQQGT